LSGAQYGAYLERGTGVGRQEVDWGAKSVGAQRNFDYRERRDRREQSILEFFPDFSISRVFFLFLFLVLPCCAGFPV